MHSEAVISTANSCNPPEASKEVDEFFENPTFWSFENPVRLTREEYLAYIASMDDTPLPGDAGYEEHAKMLNETFDKESVDGLMACDRVTRVYMESV